MNLRTMFFSIFWIFISGLAICQITDDFTDGEIHTNPVWSGDTSLFWVVDPGNSGDGSLASGANDDGWVLCSKPNINDAVILLSALFQRESGYFLLPMVQDGHYREQMITI